MDNKVIIGDFTKTDVSSSFTFFSSDNDKIRVKIGAIAAKKVSTGFSGLKEKFDFKRVSLKINDKTTKQVSVSVDELAKLLKVAKFQIILSKINPFSNLERFVVDKLQPTFLDLLTEKLKFKSDAVRISRKVHNFLNDSFLIVKRKKSSKLKKMGTTVKKAGGTVFNKVGSKLKRKKSKPKSQEEGDSSDFDGFDIYRVEKKSKGKRGDKVIGQGSFKKAKLLTDLKTREKKVLAVPKKGFEKKCKVEATTHEKLESVPNIAQARGVKWLRGDKKSKKVGLLMPCYSGTIDDFKHLAVKEKLKCSLQIAKAVKALFDKKLLHFDIKPDNIFMQKEGGVVNAYLADLGGVREFSSISRDIGDLLISKIPLVKKARKENNILRQGWEFTSDYFPLDLTEADAWDFGKLQKAVIFSFGKTFKPWFSSYQIGTTLSTLLTKATSNNSIDRPTIDQIIKALESEL